MKKKLMALILAAAMTVSMVACGSGTSETGGAADSGTAETPAETETQETTVEAQAPSDAGGVFKLGCSQPLTGTQAQPGECAYNAVKLAVKQFNEEGGFLGETIEVIAYDDQGAPEEAVKVASKLVEADQVDAVIGSCISSAVLSSGEIYNEAGIPTFGTGTSPTWMAQGWEYIFRACQNTDFALPLTIGKLQDLGITRAAIFTGQDDSGVAGTNTFTELAEAAGIEITTTESYVEGNTDFSGQVAKIINSDPEVVFISTLGPTMPLIVKQLRQFGYNGLCFTKDLYQVDALQVAGASSNGVAFAYPYLSYTSVDECNDEFVKEFLIAYEEEYGELPVSDCAYRAYDSMLVLKAAVEAAGSTDKEAVAAAISTLDNVQTLAGPQDFTQGDREGLHEFNIYVISDENYITFDEWEGTEEFDTVMEASGLK